MEVFCEPEFATVWKKIVLDWNEVRIKSGGKVTLMYFIFGTRMSGEETTSLGNGLLNYLSFKFYLHNTKQRGKIVVEGDDSLMVLQNILGIQEHYRKLGLEIEVKTQQHFWGLMFC